MQGIREIDDLIKQIKTCVKDLQKDLNRLQNAKSRITKWVSGNQGILDIPNVVAVFDDHGKPMKITTNDEYSLSSKNGQHGGHGGEVTEEKKKKMIVLFQKDIKEVCKDSEKR